MTTLFDYLSWRGDLPLSADPFHEVDGVILARFTYMPFHRVLRRDSLTPTTASSFTVMAENWVWLSASRRSA